MGSKQWGQNNGVKSLATTSIVTAQEVRGQYLSSNGTGHVNAESGLRFREEIAHYS